MVVVALVADAAGGRLEMAEGPLDALSVCADVANEGRGLEPDPIRRICMH